MRQVSNILTVLAAFGVFWMLVQVQSQQDAQRFSGVVNWVTDGDTLRVAGHEYPIRLWGVDAPERDTPEGVRAGRYLTTLVKGRRVECVSVAIDKYRRTVAKCSVNGRGVSELVLERGHGVEMCRFTGGQLGGC